MRKMMNHRGFRWSLVALCALEIIGMSYLNGVISWYITGEVLTVIQSGSLDRDTSFEDKMQGYEEEGTANAMRMLRKAAHVIQFFVFSSLLYFALRLDYSVNKSLFLAFIGGWIFGGLDEFHQTFVPGRDGNVVDVLIDGAGVTLGVGFSYMASRLRKVQAHER